MQKQVIQILYFYYFSVFISQTEKMSRVFVTSHFLFFFTLFGITKILKQPFAAGLLHQTALTEVQSQKRRESEKLMKYAHNIKLTLCTSAFSFLHLKVLYIF